MGRLGLVDFDRVDESNLQRQVLHGTASWEYDPPDEAEVWARMRAIIEGKGHPGNALAWSAGIYLMLVMQPLQREATVARLALSFLGSLLTMSVLPTTR